VEKKNGTQIKLLYNRKDYSGLCCDMSAEIHNCEASREPLLGNGSANTPVAKAMTETDMQATINELFGSDVPSAVGAEAK
jgi:hypothetical protein